MSEKCQYSEFFWSYFPRSKLNTERYSKCGKILTRKIPNTDAFHAMDNEIVLLVICALHSLLLRFNHDAKYKFRHLISEMKQSRIANAT